MSFRCPSDPQARFLRQIADKDTDVIWVPPAANVYGRSFATLYFEVEDREAGKGHFRFLADCRSDQIKVATVNACIKYGWLSTDDRVFASGITVAYIYVSRPEAVVAKTLTLTDDGELALNLWHQRKLNSPPPELEPLAAADRELLELAARADALGFAVMPINDNGRRTARRLARTPYARRGWGAGAGTRSLVPTGIGEVAALPDTADVVESGQQDRS